MKNLKAVSPSRLLPFLKENLKEFSLKDIRWAIEHNRCAVNGLVERFCSYSLKKGDLISFFPEKRPSFQYDSSKILYEDADLLAYHKPAYFDSECVATHLKASLVHRLDRDTTGILLLAKSEEKTAIFQNLFRQREMIKTYLAIVNGPLEKKEMTIEGNLKKTFPRQGVASSKMTEKGEGLWAKTQVYCLKKNKKASLLQCEPLTGRTHQIRAHVKSIGHPILGDYEYGKRDAVKLLFRPLLHAVKLTFVHPISKEPLTLSAPLPADFLFWQKELDLLL